MADVSSSWKLTFDPTGTPVVLLDIGDTLAGEIRWASQRGGEVIPLVDGAAPFLRDGRNRSISVSYDRMESGHSSHAAVCKAVMQRLIAHGNLTKAQLKIEALGVAECYWLASACLVPTVEPGIRVMGRAETATRYTLVFASITEVATGLPALTLPALTPANPGTLL